LLETREIELRLKRKKYKFTEERKRLEQYFRSLGVGQHVTKQEILKGLQAQNFTIHPSSFQGCIQPLVEVYSVGVLVLPNGTTLYEAINPHNRWHSHVVCESCGLVENFESKSIADILIKKGKARHFTNFRPSVLGIGICRNCQDNRHPPKPSAQRPDQTKATEKAAALQALLNSSAFRAK